MPNRVAFPQSSCLDVLQPSALSIPSLQLPIFIRFMPLRWVAPRGCPGPLLFSLFTTLLGDLISSLRDSIIISVQMILGSIYLALLTFSLTSQTGHTTDNLNSICVIKTSFIIFSPKPFPPKFLIPVKGTTIFPVPQARNLGVFLESTLSPSTSNLSPRPVDSTFAISLMYTPFSPLPLPLCWCRPLTASHLEYCHNHFLNALPASSLSPL